EARSATHARCVQSSARAWGTGDRARAVVPVFAARRVSGANEGGRRAGAELVPAGGVPRAQARPAQVQRDEAERAAPRTLPPEGVRCHAGGTQGPGDGSWTDGEDH